MTKTSNIKSVVDRKRAKNTEGVTTKKVQKRFKTDLSLSLCYSVQSLLNKKWKAFRRVCKKIHKEKARTNWKIWFGLLTLCNDIFYWNSFQKSKNDQLGHFFRMKLRRLMHERHQYLLGQWFQLLSVRNYTMCTCDMIVRLTNFVYPISLLILFSLFSFFLVCSFSFIFLPSFSYHIPQWVLF